MGRIRAGGDDEARGQLRIVWNGTGVESVPRNLFQDLAVEGCAVVAAVFAEYAEIRAGEPQKLRRGRMAIAVGAV